MAKEKETSVVGVAVPETPLKPADRQAYIEARRKALGKSAK